ncbi:MAG TPA: ATP-dependent zinc metalloprotease FtsH [Firmicutes bacterium]|nr:ATP-dependent zinc metalloprotease FtsH [Bacillota bacterium]
MVIQGMYQSVDPVRQLTYSELNAYIRGNSVLKAVLIGDQSIQGLLKDGTKFQSMVPVGKMAEISDLLIEQNVEIEAQAPQGTSWWVALLPNIITLIVFIGIWLFILNQMQGGNNRAMSFGKSRARLHTEDKIRITFNDVAGVDEAKQELVEIVEFLKQPKKFADLGAKIPKGVLLIGPPGTGKTLLARAVAGEAGVPFFSISGSEFVEMFVGVGASRVRDLFDTAKKNAPCLIFIDELDAVGRQRGAGLGGGHDEREQTLNQLLVEMDGFETNSGIIVMAATNRADVLDPALLRPGRFDRKVVVDRPDLVGREEILKIHARNKPLHGVDLKVLARRTPGFAGADLENLLNEAAILAARKGQKKITMLECEEAIDRVIMGPEKKKRVLTEEDMEVFAYHEAGHAVVSYFLPNSDPVHKVSIIGRGQAGGYTMYLPETERYVMTKSKLLDELTNMLGGRAAEILAFNEYSTGAQNDLERVTRIARKMVMEWGMSEKLGPLTFGHPGGEDLVFLGRDISRDRNFSEEVAAAIDSEVRSIIESCYQRALDVLTENRDRLDAVVAVLKEKETIDHEEFMAIMEGRELPEPKAEADEKPVQKQVAAIQEQEEEDKKREPIIKTKQEPVVGIE